MMYIQLSLVHVLHVLPAYLVRLVARPEISSTFTKY
jgi:hypothetical protein